MDGADEEKHDQTAQVEVDDAGIARPAELEREPQPEEKGEQRIERLGRQQVESGLDGAIERRQDASDAALEVHQQDAEQREPAQNVDKRDSLGGAHRLDPTIAGHLERSRHGDGGPERMVSNQPTTRGRPSGAIATPMRWARVPLGSGVQVTPASEVRSRVPE